MASSEIFTCKRVLDIMLILGFMFNQMLKVNMSMAILDMMTDNKTNTSTSQNSTQKFDWNESERNDILGSFFWGYVLTQILGGRLAEMFGTRIVYGTSMLLAGLITVLTPIICPLGYLYTIFLRVALGLVLGVTWPSLPPMTFKWVIPKERSRFASHMMANSVGVALTMVMCGYLISYFGWPSVFYVTGSIGIVWALAWFYLVYDSPAQHPRISKEEKTAIESQIETRIRSKGEKTPWCQILRSGPVWAIIIANSSYVFGYYLVINQLPTYMKKILHFDIRRNGLLSSLPYLGNYIAALIGSSIADKLIREKTFSRKNIRKLFTTFGLLVPGVIFIFLSQFGNSTIMAVTLFIISTTATGVATTGYLANCLDITSKYSGTVFGMANTLAAIAGYLSTGVVSLVLKEKQDFEHWKYIFVIVFANYFLGTIVFALLASGKLQKWNGLNKELPVLPTENGQLSLLLKTS